MSNDDGFVPTKFNILALLYKSFLHDETDDASACRCNLSFEDQALIDSDINRLIEQHQLNNSPLGPLENAQAAGLLAWIGRQDDPLYLLALLQRLDALWNLEANGRHPRLPDCFVALNDNFAETGIYVLPRLHCICQGQIIGEEFEETHKNATRLLGNINSVLLHFLLYTEADYHHSKNGGPSFQIQNHFIEAVFDRTIKLALSPLTNRDVLNINPFEEKRKGQKHAFKYFSVLPHREEDAAYLNAQLKKALICAAKNNADIFVGPEMLGTKEMTEEDPACGGVLRMIAELCRQLLSEGLCLPQLIFLPTYWSDSKNILFVTDNTGRIICKQEKQLPFELLGYEEHLLFEKRVLHILHIPKIGRIMMPICKDALNDVLLHDIMLRLFHTTLAISPSYSTGTWNFNKTAASFDPFHCSFVWCNTCSVTHHYTLDAGQPRPFNIRQVGIVYGTSDDQKIKLTPRCTRGCVDGDDGCLFLAEIPLAGGPIKWEHLTHMHKANGASGC